MVYDFSILSWYELSGVDVAQVRRDPFFQKAGEEVKYIFTDVPDQMYIERYQKLGLRREQMLSMHAFMTGKTDISGSISASDWIAGYMKIQPNISVIRDENSIEIKIQNQRVMTMFLREDGESFYAINYYEYEKLIAREVYADRLLWTFHYVTAQNENGSYARLSRTTFYDADGRICFELLPGGDIDIAKNMRIGLSADARDYEKYIFPDGEVLTKPEFLKRFLEALHMTKDDMIFIDRPMRLAFIQPLFEMHSEAPIYLFLHSGHYYLPGEDPDAIFWNKEYYYYFKNADRIRAFIVSTKEQKKDLQERMKDYGLKCPDVYVIPASGIPGIERPQSPRKPYSIMTASRLIGRKGMDIMIKAVIRAHETIPELTFDIYGKGPDEYVDSLKQIIAAADAGDYIRFMGRQLMTGVYPKYEVYLTAAQWETLGLSLMEAVAAGQALIGFDVRYGNKVFIRDGENGVRIPMSIEQISSPKLYDACIAQMADAICEVFKDRKRMKKYEKKSYEIAEEYLDERIEEKWLELLENVNKERR